MLVNARKISRPGKHDGSILLAEQLARAVDFMPVKQRNL